MAPPYRSLRPPRPPRISVRPLDTDYLVGRLLEAQVTSQENLKSTGQEIERLIATVDRLGDHVQSLVLVMGQLQAHQVATAAHVVETRTELTRQVRRTAGAWAGAIGALAPAVAELARAALGKLGLP